jgi:hypothetical protein
MFTLNAAAYNLERLPKLLGLGSGKPRLESILTPKNSLITQRILEQDSKNPAHRPS